MTKKIIRKQQQTLFSRFTWIWAGVGLLFFVIGGIVLWNRFDSQTTLAPQVTGAPRLAVDQTMIDEGDVKLGKLVRSAFRLQNVGDQPLQILGEPMVEVIEGC